MKDELHYIKFLNGDHILAIVVEQSGNTVTVKSALRIVPGRLETGQPSAYLTRWNIFNLKDMVLKKDHILMMVDEFRS